MGDVITKFKLETTQFDSKLRDSAQEMSKLTQYLKNAGGEFDRFAQKHVDAAKALGQTESGATNLKDKLRDLVSAYNNVAKAYENLTVEQQKTDFGKAMASSLDQLQQRITQTKNELYSMTDTTKQAEGGLSSLNNIFGVSISKLAGWGAAISVAKGALDVAKDAFFASEANIDEWGRTVESSKAIYEGFLTSINTGDISGYLSRISQISQAARDAYDALDLLGTQKTIQSPQLAKKQAEITRMRSILQTGVFIESADGRKSASGLKTGDKLSKEQLNYVAKQLESAMMEVANITKSQVKSATNAIDKMYKEQALILGVSKQEYKRVTSSWKEFQAASNMADEYKKWRAEHTIYSTMNTSAGAVVNYKYDDSKNPYRQWAWLSTFKDDGERYQRLVTEIQNREAAKSGLYGQYGQIYRRINKVEGYNTFGGGGSGSGDVNKDIEQTTAMQEGLAGLSEKSAAWFVRNLKEQLSKTEIGTETFNKIFENFTDASAVKNLLEYAVRNGVDTAVFPKEELMEKLINGDDISNTQLQGIVDRINTYLKDKKIDLDFTVGTIKESPTEEKEKGDDDKQDKKKSKSKWKRSQTDDEGSPYGVYGVSKMSGGLNSLISSVEQLGIELPEGMKQIFGGIQAVTNILTSIMTIVEAIEMIQSSTSFLPFFANGGIVPHAAGGAYISGNHYSGDVTPVLANAGEVILSRSEQGNLVSQLQNAEGGNGGGYAQPFVSGEQIYIGLSNYLRRSGRGELMTARR